MRKALLLSLVLIAAVPAIDRDDKIPYTREVPNFTNTRFLVSRINEDIRKGNALSDSIYELRLAITAIK